MSETIELLPCPFCGVTPVLRERELCGYVKYQIKCRNCKQANIYKSKAAEAIRIWNTRPDLMAERKSVDLDTLFPKEVMEKAMYYQWEGVYLPKIRYGIAGNIQDVVPGGEGWIIAYQEVRGDLKELARVHVRLGLTVQKMED